MSDKKPGVGSEFWFGFGNALLIVVAVMVFVIAILERCGG